MNKTKVLQLIRDFRETLDFSILEKLENLVIENIKLDKVVETTSKTRYNTANKVLKRHKGIRPVLEKVIIENGIQIFTDSYILFRLKNIIPELPEHKDISIYPKTDYIFNNARSYNSSIKYTCKDLKQLAKIDKIVEFKTNDGFKITVDSKLLLEVLIILDYKNKDIVEIFYSNYSIYKPLYFINNGDEGILLPLRKEVK